VVSIIATLLLLHYKALASVEAAAYLIHGHHVHKQSIRPCTSAITFYFVCIVMSFFVFVLFVCMYFFVLA